jgi:hypothetical protein
MSINQVKRKYYIFISMPPILNDLRRVVYLFYQNQIKLYQMILKNIYNKLFFHDTSLNIFKTYICILRFLYRYINDLVYLSKIDQ